MLTPFKLTRLVASNVKMGYDEKKKMAKRYNATELFNNMKSKI